MDIMIIIFIWISIIVYVSPKGMVFSPEGRWIQSFYPNEECLKYYLCSPSNLTWYPDYAISSMTNNISINTINSSMNENQSWMIYNMSSGCKALNEKGITSIFLQGDSYIRHMASSLLLILTDNYRNGSHHPEYHDTGKKDCEYHNQFIENRCALKEDYYFKEIGNVCHGTVQIDTTLHIPPTAKCSQTQKNVVIMSYGNHRPRNGNGQRWGINDPDVWKLIFRDNPFAPVLTRHTNINCSVYWMSTHYRLRQSGMTDESFEQIQKYNTEMRDFFESGQCGHHIGYIDVFNMTASLVTKHNNDALSMSFDGLHWGMAVNQIKAQILLNAILQNHQ